MHRHYEKEKNFWDSKGETAYSVLSEYDSRRVIQWVDWHGGGNVLDIGGGSGAAGNVINDEKTWTVCLDISYELVRFSKNTKVQGDALKLPFSDQSFDLIVAAAFFHHLPGLEIELLRECYRVLKVGGKIVGYDPNADSIQNRIFMTDGFLRLNLFSPDERPIHVENFKKVILDCGLSSFEFRYFSMRYQKITFFEFIQRYFLNPAARLGFERFLHRWFFWSAQKLN